MTARDYGPHDPTTAPTTVPVLRVIGPRGARRRLESAEPVPVLLARQRATINTRAHREGQS